MRGTLPSPEISAVWEEILPPEAGPRRTTSLAFRREPLADPAEQRRVLEALPLAHLPHGGDFHRAVEGYGDVLRAGRVSTLQLNLGKLCNMSCRHCHVDSGPDRTVENMDRATLDACLHLLDESGATTVDITGGAPELNPHFRYLVDQLHRRGVHIIDRCNLTVLLLPRMADLPTWLGERGVELVCSLPHYRRPLTDTQRGEGTWRKSIDALHLLNLAGYGQGDPKRRLTLMSNPSGAFLLSEPEVMEREWKAHLATHHDITFDHLITLTNMPISRFLEWLQTSGNLPTYMEKLVTQFNGATLPGLMCRGTLSVGWDGSLYDCDFNQMLDLAVEGPTRPTVFNTSHRDLEGRAIKGGRHCFGCTAGSGSSCGGTLVT